MEEQKILKEVEAKKKTDKPKAKSKSNYLNIAEQIQRMKVTFSNAKLKTILPRLETIGYDEKRLNGFLTELSNVELLSQSQKKAYAEQYAETERFNKKRSEIEEVYRKHLALCKILFKNNKEAIASLELSSGRKEAYGAWYQQVSNFYAQLLGNNVFKDQVATINIKEDDLNAQKNALLELAQIKEKQTKEAGEAQKATEERDKAFYELFPKYTELVSYAKVIFDGDQILEQLGIIVKRQ